jgi:predicted negative regulator of RcsB-dependent stress response
MAVHDKDQNQLVIARAKDFWTRYSKALTIAAAVIILGVGGWFGYKKFYKEPREKKAIDAIYRAEEIYRNAMFTDKTDSIVNLALKGSGTAPGFLKVIKDYSGTKVANLAKFYAGSCYVMLNDNANALKYLDGYRTDSKLIQAHAWKLLGDIYSDQGKNKDAFDYYKKAAHHFPENDVDSPEYLWIAAYFAEKVLNDQKQAIELYKELKEDYPDTQRGAEADKYLARLGVLTTE